MPPGVEVERVRNAAELHAAVMSRVEGQDVVIMAAAVADYTPAGGAQAGKVAKQDGPMTLSCSGRATCSPISGACANSAKRPVLVGFAAETSDVVSKARAKLAAKNVDLDRRERRVADATQDSRSRPTPRRSSAATARPTWPLRSKRELAARILDRVEQLS